GNKRWIQTIPTSLPHSPVLPISTLSKANMSRQSPSINVLYTFANRSWGPSTPKRLRLYTILRGSGRHKATARKPDLGMLVHWPFVNRPLECIIPKQRRLASTSSHCCTQQESMRKQPNLRGPSLSHE